jgi:hypothetical protein
MHTACMTAMNPVEPRKVDEEQLYQAQPMVRALVIERYEALYRLVEVHVRRAEEDDRPPDPRWAEIGVRVLKEITHLYRLSTPPRVDDAEDDLLHGVDPAAVVLLQLEELEAKARAAS